MQFPGPVDPRKRELHPSTSGWDLQTPLPFTLGQRARVVESVTRAVTAVSGRPVSWKPIMGRYAQRAVVPADPSCSCRTTESSRAPRSSAGMPRTTFHFDLPAKPGDTFVSTPRGERAA